MPRADPRRYPAEAPVSPGGLDVRRAAPDSRPDLRPRRDLRLGPSRRPAGQALARASSARASGSRGSSRCSPGRPSRPRSSCRATRSSRSPTTPRRSWRAATSSPATAGIHEDVTDADAGEAGRDPRRSVEAVAAAHGRAAGRLPRAVLVARARRRSGSSRRPGSATTARSWPTTTACTGSATATGIRSADGHGLGRARRRSSRCRSTGRSTTGRCSSRDRTATGLAAPSAVLEIWTGELRYAYEQRRRRRPDHHDASRMHRARPSDGDARDVHRRGEGAARRRLRAPRRGRQPLVEEPIRDLRRPPGTPSRLTAPATSFARRSTASNIGGVSRPVNVFCWLG